MTQRAWRAGNTKKSPQQREVTKEPQKPAKNSLQDHCRQLSLDLASARRARLDAEQKARYRREEDDLMVLLYGPDWRTRNLGDGYDSPQKKAS